MEFVSDVLEAAEAAEAPSDLHHSTLIYCFRESDAACKKPGVLKKRRQAIGQPPLSLHTKIRQSKSFQDQLWGGNIIQEEFSSMVSLVFQHAALICGIYKQHSCKQDESSLKPTLLIFMFVGLKFPLKISQTKYYNLFLLHSFISLLFYKFHVLNCIFFNIHILFYFYSYDLQFHVFCKALYFYSISSYFCSISASSG